MRLSELDNFKYLEQLFMVHFGNTCPKKPPVCTSSIVHKEITKFDLSSLPSYITQGTEHHRFSLSVHLKLLFSEELKMFYIVDNWAFTNFRRTVCCTLSSLQNSNKWKEFFSETRLTSFCIWTFNTKNKTIQWKREGGNIKKKKKYIFFYSETDFKKLFFKTKQ